MGSIVFVAYQKVEKNAFEGLRQKNKKNKLPAPGFEPGTLRSEVCRPNHAAMRHFDTDEVSVRTRFI